MDHSEKRIIMLVALSFIVMGCSQRTSSDEKANKKSEYTNKGEGRRQKEDATKEESKKVVDKEYTADVKKFSFKRGIRLRLKGQIPLLVAVVIR
ncbi:hypothetical protein Q0N12_22235 [Rossellomorea marisflavi]